MFKLILVSVLLAITCGGYSQGKDISSYSKVEFTQVGQSKFDTLQFKAIVKSVYRCPPCPEGSQCKPCLGDHVLVTNGNSEFDFRVFTHQLSMFEVDKSYDFTVRFRSALHRIDNLELVFAKRIN
jgi:hypothetical protein